MSLELGNPGLSWNAPGRFQKIEEDADHIIKQPNGFGWVIKLPINILVSLMIIVSHGDDFTVIAHLQSFTKSNSRD